MDSKRKKALARQKRHWRIRKVVSGSTDQPRLAVFRSHKHIYCQLIDDQGGKTLASASTMEKGVRSNGAYGGNRDAAREVGVRIAERAKECGVARVAFDRGGYKYHGRVRSLAEAAREGGLKF
jgi:large subunit ribosomal protein L18